MTFGHVLEETTVLVCFEKLESEFKDIEKPTITLHYSKPRLIRIFAKTG